MNKNRSEDIWRNPKILRDNDIMKSILNKNTSIPIHIEIDCIETCNHRCKFCYYHGRKSKALKESSFNGRNIFPYERLISLIDELREAGTKAISFTGTGETLMYPNIYKILQKILDNNIKYGITTNLNIDISDKNLDILSRASWIRCSLNASTNETYRKIHKPINKTDNIDRVLDNIGLLENINISYVIIKDNVREIVDTTKLVSNLGVNSIFFRPEMRFDNRKESRDYIKIVNSNIKKARKLETNGFKVYESIGEQHINEDLKCYYSNYTSYIDSCGDVYPCCVTKYNKKYIYGNILNRNFVEFWNSDERKNNYNKLIMKSCPPCKHYLDNSIMSLIYNEEEIVNEFV